MCEERETGQKERERIFCVVVETDRDRYTQYWAYLPGDEGAEERTIHNVHAYPPGPPSRYPYPYRGGDGWFFESRWTVDDTPWCSSSKPRRPEDVRRLLDEGKPGPHTIMVTREECLECVAAYRGETI